MQAVLYKAYLLLGSNIESEFNIRRAIRRLEQFVRIQAISTTWETQAVDSPGPNFLNVAVEIVTDLDAVGLKNRVLRPIEQELGRVRSNDKNAPRTIDLDILIFEGKVCDSNLWLNIFRALPMSELLPDLQHPQTGLKLSEVAKGLRKNSLAVAHPEFNNLFKQA